MANLSNHEMFALQAVFACLNSRPEPMVPDMPTLMGAATVVLNPVRSGYVVNAVSLLGRTPKVEALCDIGLYDSEHGVIEAFCIIWVENLEQELRLEFDCSFVDDRLDVRQREDNKPP